MGKTWYIFRHGLAAHGRYQGEEKLTADVLPEGKPAVIEMAEYLAQFEFDYFVSSPIPRTLTTAEIVSQKIGLDFEVDERIKDIYLESMAELRARVYEFWQELAASSRQQLLISTHGVIIAALRHFIIDGNFSDEQAYDFPDVASLLIIEDGQQTFEKTFS